MNWLKSADRFLDRCCLFLLALLLLLILRIPTLFEPYWYGDEAIYLTIGTAMRHGERLYAEIVDHKTPLIYFLAMTPTQVSFRVLLIFWMFVTTTTFYLSSKVILPSSLARWISLLIFILLTTLPWFEGPIPNGELFVMGFVITALALLVRVPWIEHFFTHSKIEVPTSKELNALSTRRAVIISGILLSLAVLTKVPAIFDVAAIFSLAWFMGLNVLFQSKKLKNNISQLLNLSVPFFLMLGALIVPIFLSIMYFVLRGSGKEYLDFGLLYNFHYVNNWALNFDNPLYTFLFSWPGKISLLAAALGTVTLGNFIFSARTRFIITWFWLSLCAALLSNRPYPHYFLQVIPSVSLLAGLLVSYFGEILSAAAKPRPNSTNRRTSSILVFESILVMVSLFIFWKTTKVLNVGFYPVVEYYAKFGRLMTGKITPEEYRNSFNHLMKDNYAVAPLLRESGESTFFIWGTNPTLYALTQMSPTGRFTVSFHIKDLDVYDETLTDLQRVNPTFIVVMKDETDPFPAFYTYLHQNYMPNQAYDNFTLWKRI